MRWPAIGADADAQHHVAQLRDGGVGQNLLEVGLDEGEAGGEERSQRADPGGGQGGVLGDMPKDVGARDHVDAGCDHGGGVDEGGDRRGAGHGVRQPDEERYLGALARGSEQQQQADEVAAPGECAVLASSNIGEGEAACRRPDAIMATIVSRRCG